MQPQKSLNCVFLYSQLWQQNEFTIIHLEKNLLVENFQNTSCTTI